MKLRVDADLPWRDIAGFRNVPAHNYLGIGLSYVWRVIEDDVPTLNDGRFTTTTERST